MLRLLLLLFGLFTLVGLIWNIGPARILEAVTGLGPGVLAVVLLPSTVMYVLEALGWRITLGPHRGLVRFWRLLAIRTAGEVVNMTTPTAYIGGEPLKAYLLKRHGVPLVDGMASVITAKTTMTVAEVGFILVGITLWFGTKPMMESSSGAAGSPPSPMLAAVLSVTLLAFGLAIFFAIQRRGLFASLLNAIKWLRIRAPFLESREEKLRALDQAILDFYARDRRGFLLALSLFFLGWLAEALEVYTILSYLGPPPGVAAAVAIGALSVLIKGGTFFIPGSLGAQEGGNFLLLVAYGYSDLTGITFALLRRLRELIWIGIGLVCLMLLKGPAKGDGLSNLGV